MLNLYKFSKVLVTLSVVILCLEPLSADAKPNNRKLIFDTEIDATLRFFADPLLRAANIPVESVRIIVVKDNNLNAFVSNGRRLFLHTGLLLEFKSPLVLLGVLAHELGHIAGGHIARKSRAIQDASKASMVATVLGTVATIAGGRSDVSIPISQSLVNVVTSSLLRHNRIQEAAADHAALRFLESAGFSAIGVNEILKTLLKQELLHTTLRSPYALTHPPTKDRILLVKKHLKLSQHTGSTLAPIYDRLFQRMVAKLHGFLLSPRETFLRYPITEKTPASRYAHAIASFQNSDTNKALKLVNELIREFPNDGYYWELKGQILFKIGKAPESLRAYKTALSHIEKAPLIETAIGQAALAINSPTSNKEALKYLKKASIVLPDLGFIWHQLAIAQGRTGDLGMATLSLAEEAVIHNRIEDARRLAHRAQTKLKRGTSGWQRADDIVHLTNRNN